MQASTETEFHQWNIQYCIRNMKALAHKFGTYYKCGTYINLYAWFSQQNFGYVLQHRFRGDKGTRLN